MRSLLISAVAATTLAACGTPPSKAENASPNNENSQTNNQANNSNSQPNSQPNSMSGCEGPAPGCGMCEAPVCENGVWACQGTPCAQPDCEPVSSSTLAGVSIELSAERCAWTLAEAAAGIEIGYTVRISEAHEIMPTSQQNGCDDPGESGLRQQERVTGNDQLWCMCDVGNCPAEPITVNLVPGDYPFSFAWDGVNWTGPSDFNNPKGAPFPAGSYNVEVRAVGTVGGEAYEVVGTLPIELVD